MDASLAICTETWLRDGSALDDDIDDLLHGSGIGFIPLNRKPSGGLSHGGVAIAYRAAVMSMKAIKLLPNPDDFEVLASIATLSGHSRKLVTLAVYVPPGYAVSRGRACLAHVAESILEAKRRYREPYICLLYTSPSPRD